MISVAVDIRDLQIATTGTKTFLEGVCNEFKKGHPNFIFHFLTTSGKAYTGKNKLQKIREHILFFIWKQIQLPLKAYNLKCDIIFCSDYFVPYLHLGYTTIPVFHDAFFREFPEQYNHLWLQLFNTIGIRAAKRAAFVVTPTQYTLQSIQQAYNLDANKIRIIYEAGKSLETLDTDNNNFENSILNSLNNQEYILHVGTYDKRKNIPRLIEAFSKLIKESKYTHLKLLLVGKSAHKVGTDNTQEIQEYINRHQVQKNIIQAGYVSDNDLANCYKKATLFIFPSLNEGFGLPILEAFQQQVPVLIANNTCLPEVAGDAGVQFNPFDSNDIFEKMRYVLDHPALQKKMIAAGLQRVQFFSWEKTTSLLLNIFKEAVNK